ncbi:MAG: CHAT domain-containing tetratricopeptide repeat protein [Bryobacteraceae bacterium]
MKPANAIACMIVVLLGFAMRGSISHHARQFAGLEEPRDLTALRESGNKLFGAGRYSDAAAVYESGYEIAKKRGELRSAVRFLNNLGSARYLLFQYHQTAKAYLEARNLAEHSGEWEAFGALSLNLASIYLDMGEIDAAAQSADQGMKYLSRAKADYKSKLLMLSALIRVRRRDFAAANRLLREALRSAAADPDSETATEAQCWNEIGNAYLKAGDIRSAERPLLQSFRIRKLTHDSRIFYTYENLGTVRMEDGDAESATRLFGRAIDAARLVNPALLWTEYYHRGEAEQKAGHRTEAFEDYADALNWLRRWRAEVLPADAFRVSSEVVPHDVVLKFTQLGSQLYWETGKLNSAEQAFLATEESRAAGLRTLQSTPDVAVTKLPVEYWETLSRLHMAETGLIRDETPASAIAVQTLRLKLTELETKAGLELPTNLSGPDWTPQQVLARTREMLGADAVYFGFSLGPEESRRWVVARDGFEVARLPAQEQIAGLCLKFARAVKRDAPEAVEFGKQLYHVLFANASPRLLGKPVWILGLDGALFEVPFPALVQGTGPRGDPFYLLETHALQTVPGVWSLIRPSTSEPSGLHVGLADPIYNSADPRCRASIRQASFSGRGLKELTDTPQRRGEMPRLVGTSREIEQCARVWRDQGSDVVMLKGADASKHNLETAIRRNPSVLHLAAHVLFPGEGSGPGLVALSLKPGGNVEYLSATEISAMRSRLGLVVLNGCSSAHAAILPGEGLMGMTRAWLAAGARSVIATRWPTSDDNTELFSFFYKELKSISKDEEAFPFARALRAAQLHQYHTRGRYSTPAHWGAYFCVARN